MRRGTVYATVKKFFASFFQKRSAFLLPGKIINTYAVRH
jgi:hypothetical protein